VLPLVPETLPTKEQDKSKFISFELKSRAGQPAGSTPHKKFVRVIEEGTPQQWIDLIHDLEEIWTQNSVNGPTDRVLTVRALLKGKSLTAFDTALEDVRIDPDPNVIAPLPLILEHINDAMDQVANTVFPHRALKIQKLWMNRGTRKPIDMTTRRRQRQSRRSTTASHFSHLERMGPNLRIRNWLDLSSGHFPLIGARSSTWTATFYIPTLGTKAKLILECEAIELNETSDKKRKEDDDNNYNNYKKTGSEILWQELQKMGTTITVPFSASTAGATAHMIHLSAIF
jgi:hypothetical protein